MDIERNSRPFLIGTAGHVDHGKTTLVRALTGVNTDRLEEERRRGLTIDLGFAEFHLPSGREAGIVDVPGHERFLKNMLAGAAGVDFGLLVVAADEGVMPQTREHVEILHALRVPRGLTALTRADVVDPEWLEMVRAETREAVRGTFLADAPIVALDSVTRRGLDELIALLDATAAELPEHNLDAPAYLPVDRVFHQPGFGVVATGSLRQGVLRVGDPLTVYPSGRPTRVRGLQTFGRAEQEARAGMRTAVNLAGVEPHQLERGDVLASPGSLTPSSRMNVRLELTDRTRPLKHRSRIRVHLGTAETLARVLLWEAAEAAPDTAPLAHLQLEAATVARPGERFVARWYSPQAVLGGGVVLEPAAPPFRARDAASVRRLKALESGDPTAIVREALEQAGPRMCTAAELAALAGLSEPATRDLLDRLAGEGSARLTREGAIDARALSVVTARWRERLSAFHKRRPLWPGMPREELRMGDSPPLPSARFDALLAALVNDGILADDRDTVRLNDFSLRLRPDQEAAVEEILRIIREGGWHPPAEPEVTRLLGPHRATREVWDYLAASARLIRLAEGLYLHPSVVEEGIREVRSALEDNGEITVARFRDAVGASRRAAVPFLEWCDTQRITRRMGGVRTRGAAF